ncbi:MAG: tRNA-(ms[2]io[6]A)-hydroxylase [Myxococcales bacterium]|nr:tRNA-(ms[2]io[6]A)-hydroxylase [Myxococcales bacterium]
MLHLASETDPAWTRRALENLDAILLDHAHCEKKAASTALSLIFRYPERPALMLPLSRLAREELAHFEEVVGVLRGRGLEFRRQRPSPYASKLMEIVRKQEPLRLLDTLLCCAMIEARSCERMQLLGEALGEVGEAGLAKLYRGLLASEARHFNSYVDLARGLGLVSEEALRERLAEVAAHEAAVIAEAPPVARMHN